MDRGAWRATVHGPQSQTGLSDSHFHFQAVLRFPSREGHPGEARWPVFSEKAVGGGRLLDPDLLGLAWHPCWDLLGWCGQWREDTVGPEMSVGAL